MCQDEIMMELEQDILEKARRRNPIPVSFCEAFKTLARVADAVIFQPASNGGFFNSHRLFVYCGSGAYKKSLPQRLLGKAQSNVLGTLFLCQGLELTGQALRLGQSLPLQFLQVFHQGFLR